MGNQPQAPRSLMLLALLASLAIAGMRAYSAPAPVNRIEVLALLTGGAPADEVRSLIERDGISFQPTPAFLNLVTQAESQHDPDRETLSKAITAARLVNPSATEAPNESEILEHLARGAQLDWNVFPPDPQKYGPAENELRQALQLDPNNQLLHFALAKVLADEQKYEPAITELRQVLQAMPNLGAAHISLGRILAMQGNPEGSADELRKAVQLEPSSAWARGALAAALLQNHDATDAIEEIRDGLRIRPDSPSLHNSLATVLYESGDTNGSIAELHKSIQLGSNDPGTFIDLATVLRNKGNVAAEIAELRGGTSRLPGSFRLHYALAETLINERDLPAAKAELGEAIRLQPNSPQAHSELGYVLKKQHDLDGAIAEYRQAIQLDPNFAVAHANLASALYAKGDHDAAYEQTVTAYELAPNNPSIRQEFERIPERYKKLATQPPSEPKPPVAPSGEPPTTNFLYYVDANAHSLVPLEEETPTIGGRANILGGTTAYLRVIGEKSPLRLTAGSKWEFIIRPAAGTILSFRLERFEAKGGNRTLQFKQRLVPSRVSTRPGLLLFDSARYGASSIELSVPYDLAPGEYGFPLPPKAEAGPCSALGLIPVSQIGNFGNNILD